MQVYDLDVLVIGAGAAGLAAGTRLAKSNLSFRILEARSRIGGRAFTAQSGEHALDHGCGWLHSADRNCWRAIAEEAGFTIDKIAPAWGKQALDLGFAQDEQEAFAQALDALDHRIKSAAKGEQDQAASALLEAGNRWNPLLDAVSTYMSGAELDHISVLDLSRYADSEINWRVREGFGTAIGAFGAGLPVTVDCGVDLIDHSEPLIRAKTAMGELRARAVIVTVPPTVLLSGRLRFHPDLPQKHAAAEGLPLGVANKLFIALDQPEDLPSDGHLFGRIEKTATASYHLRPFGRPLIEAFFGGTLARELEAAGPRAFFDFACEELASLLGSDMRHRLHFVAATSWALDPFSGGSYSFARPGQADARRIWQAPLDNRLFFAGEASSAFSFSTAHGAYETGIKAAEEAIAALQQK